MFETFTADQWLILGLTALIGLIAGLMLSSGPKWRRRYREEHERYRTLERDNDERSRSANERIATLESRESTETVPGDEAGPGFTERLRGHDDLAVIRGLRSEDQAMLNEMGFRRYRHIAKMSADDRAAIEGRLGAEPGMIEREQWIEQARMLHNGDLDEHDRRYRVRD